MQEEGGDHAPGHPGDHVSHLQPQIHHPRGPATVTHPRSPVTHADFDKLSLGLFITEKLLQISS